MKGGEGIGPLSEEFKSKETLPTPSPVLVLKRSWVKDIKLAK